MGPPYQCLTTLGNGSTLCVSRGATITTLDLSAAGASLFSWTHPSAIKATGTTATVPEDETAGEQTGHQPPSKKRRLDEDNAPNAEETKEEGPVNGKEQKKNKIRPEARASSEQLFVVLLTATEDGHYVIAVSGQDKTLWVFEHDGKGGLKELSHRVMPKRPISLALTTDDQTILCADKFGDVYSLPLLYDPSAPVPATGPEGANNTAAAAPQQPKGANNLTVHSKRNLTALEDQRKQRENPNRDQPKEAPTFQHDLLLGHVSMLTAIVTGTSAHGRDCIITADRDEHIRVSRGIPQTHVIEGFCLGHGAFVSALAVAAGDRPELLFSGGGDDQLFVWDWRACELRCKADLLSHVAAVAPGPDPETMTSKIAVSRLISYATTRADGTTAVHVGAICERVPALFIFTLCPEENTLTHTQTLSTGGNNALDAVFIPSTFSSSSSSTSSPLLIITTDPPSSSSSPSLQAFTLGSSNDRTWSPQPSALAALEQQQQQPLPQGEPISREELDKALYGVEILRKTGDNEEGAEDQQQLPSRGGGGSGGGGGGGGRNGGSDSAPVAADDDAVAV